MSARISPLQFATPAKTIDDVINQLTSIIDGPGKQLPHGVLRRAVPQSYDAVKQGIKDNAFDDAAHGTHRFIFAIVIFSLLPIPNRTTPPQSWVSI